MVRAPCCEKMGLKKGPWTSEEDEILVNYIQKYGHGNWRALPKQAGLLRCGKSCRLRWTNYLRPDIKRGNFTKEEEDTIISLHELLGNKWSMIAARLPGRTDNEIKNVWHTHLKKRLQLVEEGQQGKRRRRSNAKSKKVSEPNVVQSKTSVLDQISRTEIPPSMIATSPVQSSSSTDTWSSSCTDSSLITGDYNSNMIINDDLLDYSSVLELPEIDESFWSETLCMENTIISLQEHSVVADHQALCSLPVDQPAVSFSSSNEDDDMDFWMRVYMEAGSMHDLTAI